MGDLGDFGKYALLNALCGEKTEDTLQLGVLWYRVPDESHNADGKYIAYLDGSEKNQRRFRDCAPSLYDGLAKLIGGGERTLERLETAGVLPADTRYFSEPLAYLDRRRQGLKARQALRSGWVQKGVDRVTGCALVFVDPDNGLQCASVSAHSRLGPKYVFYQELEPIVERGQSLVVYHHPSRQGTARSQVQSRMALLQQEVAPGRPVYAMLYRRGSARAFFVIPAVGAEALLERRLVDFLSGGWSQHFERIR